MQDFLEEGTVIQATPHMKILYAVEPVDFRKGIDGLAAICRRHLETDPFSGCMFVFGNKSGTAIKILVYDGQGYWLCQKRLSRGRFVWRPGKSGGAAKRLDAHQLSLLIYNGDPEKAVVQTPWRKISEK